MKLWTKEQRIALGVSDKEFSLLTVLDREGSLNTSALAYSASLPRVTVMRVLKTLKDRGFITCKTYSREVIWSVIDPLLLEKRLTKLFETDDGAQKITELSEVGSLMVYRGVEEMIESNKKMLIAHAGERLLAIEPNGIWQHVAGASQDSLAELNALFKDKQILVEMVLEEGFEDHLRNDIDPKVADSFLALAVDIQVVPARFLDSATEVLIFRDQILFLDWAHSVGVEIKNPSTMRVMKAMYRLLQESGRKFSFNT